MAFMEESRKKYWHWFQILRKKPLFLRETYLCKKQKTIKEKECFAYIEKVIVKICLAVQIK